MPHAEDTSLLNYLLQSETDCVYHPLSHLLTCTAEFDIVEKTSKLFTKIILLIAALMTARVIVWFFEQRAHDKEYWLIFAHVIPFLLVILVGAAAAIFIKKLVFRLFQAYLSRKGPQKYDPS